MSDENLIRLDDINYAIYKIGSWDNKYEINQIGVSSEIPVTSSTVTHVKLTMDEIRKAEYDISDKTVNGFVAIAIQLNPKMENMDIDDVIALEETEYNKIIDELDNLELLNDEDSISLDNEDYLIYKLEKECHVTNSIPANTYTKKHFLEEVKKINEALD